MREHKDLVNLIYSTQKSSKSLNWTEAIEAIRRIAAAETVAETDVPVRGLVNHTKDGRIQKTKKKCNNCKKTGHKEDKCWFKHPDQAPDFFKAALQKKGSEDNKEKEKEKNNPIRASICRAAKASTRSKAWFFNSSCTDPIVNDKGLLHNFKPFSEP